MPPSLLKKRFYAVAVGRKTGIFDSWDECSRYVTGFSNACYKSFSTWEEAQSFVLKKGEISEKAVMKPTTVTRASTTAVSMANNERDHHSLVVNVARTDGKTVDFSSSPPFSSLLSSPALLPTLEATEWKVSLLRCVSREWLAARAQEAVEVYVDGACRGNGKGQLACGGYGGFYAANDPRNFSCPLSEDEPQTNNRAELCAVICVLHTALEAEPCYNLRVFSDSKYTIFGAEYYLRKWLRNEFRGSNGSEVANRDLWMRLSSVRSMHENRYAERLVARFGLRPLVAKMVARRLALRLIHVKGHSGLHGNDMADHLAVMGALCRGRRMKRESGMPPSSHS